MDASERVERRLEPVDEEHRDPGAVCRGGGVGREQAEQARGEPGLVERGDGPERATEVAQVVDRPARQTERVDRPATEQGCRAHGEQGGGPPRARAADDEQVARVRSPADEPAALLGGLVAQRDGEQPVLGRSGVEVGAVDDRGQGGQPREGGAPRDGDRRGDLGGRRATSGCVLATGGAPGRADPGRDVIRLGRVGRAPAGRVVVGEPRRGTPTGRDGPSDLDLAHASVTGADERAARRARVDPRQRRARR